MKLRMPFILGLLGLAWACWASEEPQPAPPAPAPGVEKPPSAVPSCPV